MAFDTTHLGGPEYFGSKSGPKMWFYTTTDPILTVRGADYFADAVQRGMQLGDFVLVNVTDSLTVPTTAAVSTNFISAIGAVSATVVVAA